MLDAEEEFSQFGPLNLNEPWPKIVDRFEQIGEAVAYRTAYSRLSSQTHADAEDTLNYIFFTTNGDEEKLFKWPKRLLLLLNISLRMVFSSICRR